MSFLKNVKIDSEISWQQISRINHTNLIENGKTLILDTLTSGTGLGQVNKSYFFGTGLGSGVTTRFDLHSLSRTIFGGPLITNFSGDNIKLIRIENNTTGLNHNLFVTATGTDGFTMPFSYGYLGFNVRPQSYYLTYDRNIGWPITSGERYFYLSNISGTGTINYQIGIFGVSY